METANSAPYSMMSTRPNGGTIVKKVCRCSAPPLRKPGTVSESNLLMSEVSVHLGLDTKLSFCDLLGSWPLVNLTMCELHTLYLTWAWS